MYCRPVPLFNLYCCVCVCAGERLSNPKKLYKGEPCAWTWEELERRAVKPPFKPHLVSPYVCLFVKCHGDRSSVVLLCNNADCAYHAISPPFKLLAHSSVTADGMICTVSIITRRSNATMSDYISILNRPSLIFSPSNIQKYRKAWVGGYSGASYNGPSHQRTASM